ncbi:MAG: PH domain-containing protein [Verrucomicrobia bacterium]|nr:PH domain-containing protein [Verrucomicrobiota bacterium]MCF7708151.1 PH domain-containing protein [Verrucomicrobiota bacterium]
MFCNQCGKQVEAGAKFCSNCGATVSSVEAQRSMPTDAGEPLVVLCPRFIGWVTMLSLLPLQLFLTVWAAGFFGGFSMFAIKWLGLSLPPWSTFVFFGCLFFFGIPLLVYFGKKKTYAQTEYRFFKDRLEYVEGFWTAENKTIRYDKITETSMRRGIIQKKYGLGTIFLATPATGFQQGRSISGIRIKDVEEPERMYEQVQSLIGK